MICFEVFLNERRLCLAGMGEHGLLSQYLCWESLSPEDRAPYQAGASPHLSLIVNGRPAGESAELWRWIEGNVPIRVGDELKVRIREAPEPDAPEKVSFAKQREGGRETRRRLYEELKREFGGDHAAA